MQTTSAARRCARTFLTHFFGRGLDDDRYVVQRFHSTVDGEIKPFSGNGRCRGARKQPRKVMTGPVSSGSFQASRPQRAALRSIHVCSWTASGPPSGSPDPRPRRCHAFR